MCFRGFPIARRYPARNPEEPSACSSSPMPKLTHMDREEPNFAKVSKEAAV